MFKTPLQVEKIGKNRWRLLGPLVYDGSVQITVPVGFETDFASVPRIAWRICPPVAGAHAEPAVLHDYLCETSNDQPAADKLFLEAMKVNGVGWLKRMLMFQAVRAYQAASGKYSQREP